MHILKKLLVKINKKLDVVGCPGEGNLKTFYCEGRSPSDTIKIELSNIWGQDNTHYHFIVVVQKDKITTEHVPEISQVCWFVSDEWAQSASLDAIILRLNKWLIWSCSKAQQRFRLTLDTLACNTRQLTESSKIYETNTKSISSYSFNMSRMQHAPPSNTKVLKLTLPAKSSQSRELTKKKTSFNNT